MNRECISYEVACERFDYVMDEAGPIRVAAIAFYPSRILRELDPTGYRCEVLDYADTCGYDIMEYVV